MRRPTLFTCLAGAVFLGALLSRSAWFYRAPFHPDESTVLWMALEAVRDPQIPDHGLVSSFHVFQPPGLVWMTMPFVALGGGRPELVIFAFASLNAAAIAFLVVTVARVWGLVYAAVLGAFLIVGPDAFFSAWVWHPSLFTGAMALLMTAGIRVRQGSAWWGFILVAVPGLYALIHYSGFVLYAPAFALLLLSRRTWMSLILPLSCGAVLVALAWGPFVLFEIDRNWVDLTTVAEESDNSSALRPKLEDRFEDLKFALSHLGQSLHGSVYLTRLILALVVLAFLIAGVRRRWRDSGFALPAAMLVSGLAAQVALDQGRRTDVLMLLLVPLYALAAWAVFQAVELTRVSMARRALASVVAIVVVALVVVIGSIDLVRSIRAVPDDERLSEAWRAARSNEPVYHDASVHPALSENRFYLACDPPYDWGSQIWYLQEVLNPGSGWAAAREGGAFRARVSLCDRPRRAPAPSSSP